MRVIRLLAFLFIPSLILNVILLNQQSETSRGVPVVGVIDGDTIVLEGKSKVRLRHVDAPDDPNCGSREATQALEKLVIGTSVRIEEQIPDQYGRGMALVYAGDTLINEELLASGWVRYHHDISSHEERLKKASEKAKTSELGIYGKCQLKENKKCPIKGNIDSKTKTHIYYVPGCVQYNTTIVQEDVGEQWFCTEKEARDAGYRKSERC